MNHKFNLYFARFVEWMKVQGFSDSTRKSYRVYLRKFMSYLEEETDITTINRITADDIYSYQSYLYYAKTKEGKPLSVLTQHSALSVVRTFFGFLLQSNHLAFDPTSGITLPKKPQSLPEVMNLKEVEKLLDQPDCTTPLGFRDRTIMEIFYVTGIRNSELCNLKIYDVDVQTSQLRITSGKGAKDRIVPLGEVSCDYLAEYVSHIRVKLVRDKAQQSVFLSKGGRTMNPTDVSMMIRKYAKRADLNKHVTAHTFRHSCATHMLKNGADIRHIQLLLGHASPAATQIYTQVELTDLKAVHRKYHPRERFDET